jgi:hypothetical protein
MPVRLADGFALSHHPHGYQHPPHMRAYPGENLAYGPRSRQRRREKNPNPDQETAPLRAWRMRILANPQRKTRISDSNNQLNPFPSHSRSALDYTSSALPGMLQQGRTHDRHPQARRRRRPYPKRHPRSSKASPSPNPPVKARAAILMASRNHRCVLHP